MQGLKAHKHSSGKPVCWAFNCAEGCSLDTNHNVVPGIAGCRKGLHCCCKCFRPNHGLSKKGTQRVHIHYHYGIRSQKTIPTMVLGPYFHNRSVYGPSWVVTFLGYKRKKSIPLNSLGL